MLFAPLRYILLAGLLLFICAQPHRAGAIFIGGVSHMLEFGLTVVQHGAGYVERMLGK